MKSLAITALVAAQLVLAAEPALAADLVDERGPGAVHRGAFAGARLRVPLGASVEKPRAGLALTSTLRTERDGNVRFAKGLEVGFSGDDKVRMSIGGRPVAGLAPGRRGPDGDRLGVSTLAWVGIGVAVTLAVGTVLLVDAMNDASE